MDCNKNNQMPETINRLTLHKENPANSLSGIKQKAEEAIKNLEESLLRGFQTLVIPNEADAQNDHQQHSSIQKEMKPNERSIQKRVRQPNERSIRDYKKEMRRIEEEREAFCKRYKEER